MGTQTSPSHTEFPVTIFASLSCNHITNHLLTPTKTANNNYNPKNRRRRSIQSYSQFIRNSSPTNILSNSPDENPFYVAPINTLDPTLRDNPFYDPRFTTEYHSINNRFYNRNNNLFGRLWISAWAQVAFGLRKGLIEVYLNKLSLHGLMIAVEELMYQQFELVLGRSPWIVFSILGLSSFRSIKTCH